MNPDWVRAAQGKQPEPVALDIAAIDAPRLAIPPKLWNAIEAATGWFNIRKTT